MNLDWKLIVGLIEAIAWPLVAVLALYLLRRPLVELVSQVARRASKLSVYNVSIELATLPELSTTWKVGSEDARQLTSSQIFDSASTTLFNDLLTPRKADYAVVDLRVGQSWLTSRLYIFALVLGEVRNLRAFVFLENAGGVRRRFLGVATPANVQKALAARYPWLEEAYFRAAAQQYRVPSPPEPDPQPPGPAAQRFDSLTGKPEAPRYTRFANQPPLLTVDDNQSWRISNFVREFIDIIQRTSAPPPNEARSYLEMGTQAFQMSASLRFQSDLKQGRLPADLRLELAKHFPTLSPDELLVITPRADDRGWQIIDPAKQTLTAVPEGDALNIYQEQPLWERTRWIDGSLLERDLGGYLDNAWCVDSPDLPRDNVKEAIVRRSSPFVALVDEDRRFVGLIDRHALVDQMWKEHETAKTNGRGPATG